MRGRGRGRARGRVRARGRAPASLLPCHLCLPPLPPLLVFGGDDLGRQRLTRLGRHLRLLVVLARLAQAERRIPGMG